MGRIIPIIDIRVDTRIPIATINHKFCPYIQIGPKHHILIQSAPKNLLHPLWQDTDFDLCLHFEKINLE